MARSRRYEFSKQTKREALQRSGKLCEAVGTVYGLPPGQRCNAPLDGGVEFDHYPAPATDKGSDTLENCVAACKTCHRFKTSSYDVPMQAKGKRVSDKHLGIRRPSQFQSAGFARAEPQRRATKPRTPKFEGDIMARRTT
jgi:5-methylcytosine-specific restriction endonuclease McrA